MKKSKKIILIAVAGVTIISSSFYYKNKNVNLTNEDIKTVNRINEDIKHVNTTNEFINISECSEMFMNNYFEELEQIDEDEEKENIIIVNSTSKMEETYGASKIIEAPNNQYILQYNSKEEKNNAMKELKEDKNIQNVEENTQYTFTGNETYNSWGIEKIGLDEAITEANSRHLSDVTVAILDSGCNIPIDNKIFPGKIIETYNAVQTNGNMVDQVGHGTHIAGTIAEGTPDNVKILPVKISASNKIYDTDIEKALNYITYYKKADVINMSFGGYTGSMGMKTAIEAANDAGIICIASAGNDNRNQIHYPAAYDTTMCISACDSNLKKTSSSNYGSEVDFTAPGKNILSVNGTMSGTSMAAPHAACAAAILKSYNKDYNLEDAIEILKDYAIDLGSVGKDQYFGNGLVNLAGILYCECGCENCNEIYCKNCECKECICKNEKRIIKKIEVALPAVVSYNYGSLTNLSNVQLKIYYDDENYLTKYLLDLEGCEIIGYDPYCYTNQTITIKYKGQETRFELCTGQAYESAWEYEVINEEEKTIRLTNCKNAIYGNGNSIKKIYVPETIDGYTVIALGESLFRNTYEEKVILPATVTEIGTRACEGIESIDVKAKSIKVGDYAFLNSKIQEIKASITSLGVHAFENCSELKNINFAESLEIVSDYAFSGCSSLEDVTIPKETKEIGNNAFNNCTSLKEISIPKNVTNIGEKAFAWCLGLEKITVDERNQYYDSRENSNTLIEKNTSTLIQGSSNSIIPNTVKIIGKYSFAGNMNLKEIDIPEGVEEIQEEAFYFCKNIEKFKLPKSINKIGINSFGACDNATIWVYKDSFAKSYAEKNNLNYKCIDASEIWVYVTKKDYKAFETVDIQGMYIELQYDDGRREIINEGIEIKYTEDNTSFRYGDTYFTVSAYSEMGEYIEKQVSVTVNKAMPEYTIPTDIIAYVGQNLSEVKLPEGFQWMDETQILEEMGELKYKAKYIPNDIENYLIVEDIEIIINAKYEEIKNITVYVKKEDYLAFDTVNTKEMYIVVEYVNGKTEKISENITIAYNNGNESFRAGDTFFTVSANTESGQYIEHKVEVTVSKRRPEYTIPTDIIVKEGQKLSEIELPKGFQWMDENQKTEGLGDILYKAKYIPEDTDNYLIVENIDIQIYINKALGLEIGGYKQEYKAFETVNKDEIEIRVNYYNGTYEEIKENITIKYKNENTSFRYGDTSFNVSFYNGLGEYMETNITVTVIKAIPEYTIPTNITAEAGQKLSELALPQGFQWMDENETIEGSGNVIYKAKYIPNDTENYETVKNIEIIINVKNIITNNSTDYEGIYDGEEHTISIDINLTDYQIKYSINNKNYDLDTLPKFKDAGEYTIYYKITKQGYDDITACNKVIIYGIKIANDTLELRNNILIVKNYKNNYNTIHEGIKVLAKLATYKYYDKSGEEKWSYTTTTGDSIEFIINNLKSFKYKISVLGDVNGDGKISALDYVRIKNHIMKTTSINEDVQLIAADVNDDRKISALDYVRIKNYIMNGGN